MGINQKLLIKIKMKSYLVALLLAICLATTDSDNKNPVTNPEREKIKAMV